MPRDNLLQIISRSLASCITFYLGYVAGKHALHWYDFISGIVSYFIIAIGMYYYIKKKHWNEKN